MLISSAQLRTIGITIALLVGCRSIRAQSHYSPGEKLMHSPIKERKQIRSQVDHWLKHQLVVLCGRQMDGRGYVDKGREKAARYIAGKFKEFGLQPVTSDSTFVQTYQFSVNTFPGAMEVELNHSTLIPGTDYIIDAASVSAEQNRVKIKRIDGRKVDDSASWAKVKKRMGDKRHIYLINDADTICSRLGIRSSAFAAALPQGSYIIPIHGKMPWTVATDTIAATVFYVEDTVLPPHLKRATIHANAAYIAAAANSNIIACVPGQVADSYIVFTAHYDHLGMMGKEAYFPGASDNGSGTSVLLYLADYYAQHPQRCTMVFIAFSGEEAGLLGSKYFVSHPLFPLQHIRFLTNIDIMGDATEGITVVNATEYPNEFAALQRINEKSAYVPAIKSRGKAAISDHYYFSEAGVPSFFIFSNGGRGYYHDVFDRPAAVTFNNVDGVIKLLLDFVMQEQ